MFDLFPFLVGLMGSLHCLGMCGPLVVAYSLHLQPSPSGASLSASTPFPPSCLSIYSGIWCHHLAFHCGRIITYTCLGAAAGGILQAVQLSRFLGDIRSEANLVCGALLLLSGLLLLRVLPFPNFLEVPFAASGGTVWRRCLHCLFRSPNPASRGALGVMAGLMPCCLSWAMLVTAAASGSFRQGAITMFAFGVGTVPVLFFLGISASILPPRLRVWGERVAALAVIGLGISLILSGTGVVG